MNLAEPPRVHRSRTPAVIVPLMCRLLIYSTMLGVSGMTVLAIAGPAIAGRWPWQQSAGVAQQPHPSVARIVVPEADGVAQGSGTLVGIQGRFGLVVTNWHVVREATGPIEVVFPDGFRTSARVLRVDRDWDLAALLIWRPKAAPVPLAPQPPRPGDVLTIAGYGSGDYRIATGRCTQYVAPSEHHPFEMVELSATARQGDSGGPIFNTQGQLAGVLFGSGGGTTAGSYAGRVRLFLAKAWPPSGQAELLQAAPNSQTLLDSGLAGGPTSLEAMRTATSSSLNGRNPPMIPLPSAQPSRRAMTASAPPLPRSEKPQPSPATPTSGSWQRLAGDTPSEQLKTLLAAIGAISLALQVTRWLSPRKG